MILFDVYASLCRETWLETHRCAASAFKVSNLFAAFACGTGSTFMPRLRRLEAGLADAADDFSLKQG